MFVTIPQASATKVQNQWIAEVWVADKIFNYFEPFLFKNYFKENKMTVDKFFVLFYIIQKLRDPMDQELFLIFLSNAGSEFKYKTEQVSATLGISQTLFYHLGVRGNELRNITFKDIKEALETSQTTLITYKTKQQHTYVLSNKALQDLKQRESDFNIV